MNIERPSKWQIVRALLLLAILIVVVPLLLYVIGQYVGFYGGYVVLSNSMAPEFHSGDVVFVHSTSPSAVQVNDTITYHTPNVAGTNTHKVVDIVNQSNQTLFQTKGIANEEPDPYLVPPRAYIGKVVFHVPLLGVLITFLQTELGLVMFVIVPLSLLIVSEVWTLGVAYFSESGNEEDADEPVEGGTDSNAIQESGIPPDNGPTEALADTEESAEEVMNLTTKDEFRIPPDDDLTEALAFDSWADPAQSEDTKGGDD